MTSKERILIVEDDPAVRDYIMECLSMEGYSSDYVEDGLVADHILRSQTYNLVLSDLKLPGLDGLSLLSKHGGMDNDTPFLLMSGFGTVDDAVKAMKLGAVDFLTKPIKPSELLDHIGRALSKKPTPTASSSTTRGPNLIGESPKFKQVIEQLDLVSPLPSTVLLVGETGTGKEVAALYLHQHSVRQRGPFITLNCGAIPDNLLEDELFGHVKGAFTGAIAHRQGCFEMANGGTLFLDEIGTMSFHLQSKLLRILQDLEVRRLGDTRSQRVDVRIIAATNGNLEEMVSKGEFREDLFYRLSVFPITLPPLRQREADIGLLAQYFSKLIGQKLNLGSKSILPSALALLNRYDWPGNVRQLENTIERAVILARNRDHIVESDILPYSSNSADSFGQLSMPAIPDEGISFDTVVSQLERQLILKSLELSGGNKKQAAELLQMKRTTLIEKLKRLSPPA